MDLFSIGGMQRHDRLVVATLDRFAAVHGGCLVVHCLNDPPPAQLPPELAGLEATALRCFSAKRVQFVVASAGELRKASVVFYGHLGLAPLALVQRLCHPRSRRVLLLHGIEAWQYRSRIHAVGVRQMDRFVSISNYTLQAFLRAYKPGSCDHGLVVANPVSPELLSPAAGNAGPTGDAPRLLSVTRLASHDPPKGVDLVIRALPPLLSKFPELCYVVVGQGDDRPRLEALAKAVGVERAVCFLGSVSEQQLKQELGRCTLFVLPSTKEGFGLVFIEAMAYGKPVVAARATAVPEVVDHGETGLLIEPGSVQQLGESISLLLRDSVLRERMGRAAKQAVERRFTFEKFQERWFSVCDSLIRPPRA